MHTTCCSMVPCRGKVIGKCEHKEETVIVDIGNELNQHSHWIKTFLWGLTIYRYNNLNLPYYSGQLWSCFITYHPIRSWLCWYCKGTDSSSVPEKEWYLWTYWKVILDNDFRYFSTKHLLQCKKNHCMEMWYCIKRI